MIVILLIVVVLIIAGVVGAVVLLARNQRRSQAAANEVVPGRATRAPISWAGSHDPEARLHRRLRDAMAALRTVSAIDNGTTIVLRADLEQTALSIDDHLVAIFGLPQANKAELLASATKAVEAIEAGVAEYASSATRADTAQLEAGLGAVRDQLTLIAEIEKSFGPR
ncbi:MULTISPECIES: hypothetical protein [unclassified Nocardia]|uniref:hypothetical protein n=1 Tax=unclassified Nocardia TaxID=2637762 RepID=UPI001CE3BD87|nr:MULTISPECIES: hypothetical protein [unclassified Nocardia]